MTATNLTKENFGSTTKGTDVVLVDFWTLWCGPCYRFGPIFEGASGRHDGVVFGKVDTGAEQNLAFVLDIQSIPTIMTFHAGALVFRYSSLLNGAQADNLVKQARGLDPKKFKEKVREGFAD